MAVTTTNREMTDDIMSARPIYALAGSLALGLMLWTGALALII
ncbi:hypothetical protein SAMN05192583_3271 [Sphingomonas gellani]|uniref:Uncharacterized protein n=1 Tax=Sphingomonas gellani TaxID=1166340 RepID=A0A1H8IB35_9SPHN|nr:hypothetical protein [Sphingomonas gellani]SEN65551.1 hypothetical protein SAMN05192583_3271 [Sphingomonas gellani]